MIASIRQKFNAAFTEEAYQNYLDFLNTPFPGALDFSVAETPIFIDKAFHTFFCIVILSVIPIRN